MNPSKTFSASLTVTLAALVCALTACIFFSPKTLPVVAMDQLRDGDIIFHTSNSRQSKAIQLATHSKYSHMGILFHDPNSWSVYEAVGPVKNTPLQNWVARGSGQHYVVKRLKNSTSLTPQTIAALKNIGDKFRDKPYDRYFEWSDDRLYCSELVWKMYKQSLGVEIGELQKLRDFDLTSPTVTSMLAERYGTAIPLNEQVITPSAMFDSLELITVCSH